MARAYWKLPTRRWLAGDAREHRARQHGFAEHGAPRRHDGEGPRGGDAHGVHRFAHDVLPQHRADGGEAVAAAGERRAPGAFEVDIAKTAFRVGDLTEQQRPPVAEPGGQPAELVAGVGLGHRSGAAGHQVADQEPYAVGSRR